MSTLRTEALHDGAYGLDARPRHEAAALLADGQVAAAQAVRGAIPAIVEGSADMAATLRAGGKLHYIAAGSSGLMAAADAQELGGTFSIPASQVSIHMAGGLPTDANMPGHTEDNAANLDQALSGLTEGDTVIAVSASGSTPYTLRAAEIARQRGATVIGIANNAPCPLLDLADVAIHLDTPPEVLSGSTRLGAGTAQKIALNMLSTLMAVDLGHIHDGMMVNLRADNTKLRARAAGMVQQIAELGRDAADQALKAAAGDVKSAVLIGARGVDLLQAQDLLRKTEGNLRAALAQSEDQKSRKGDI